MAITNGYESVEDAIISNFATEWATSAMSTVPVAYPNMPEHLGPQASADDEFVRISIPTSFATGIVGIGERMSEQTGLLVFEFYGKLEDGTERASQAKDLALQIFQGQTLGGAYFGAHTMQVAGPDPGGRHWMESISLPFRFDPTPS